MSESNEPQASTQSFLRLFRAAIVLAVMGWLAWVVYTPVIDLNTTHPFKLGLDLAGGSHLVYEADVSKVDPVEVSELMNVLRDVIERRVNRLGVEENVVYLEQSSFVTEEPIERLVVELPGVTDVSAAVAEIGSTPTLEFKLYDAELDAQQQASLESLDSLSQATTTDPEALAAARAAQEPPFTDTGLTGRYLESAALEFAGGSGGQLSNEPLVSVRFTAEGGDLFEEITRANVGNQLGIFLDGELLSAPNII